MLVLSRKVGEGIWIGDDVYVCVVSRKGNRVRIGISAPSDVGIVRDELPGSGFGGSGGGGMLVLSRKANECIRVGGDVLLKVIKVTGTVKLGIAAPPNVRVRRNEVRPAA